MRVKSERWSFGDRAAVELLLSEAPDVLVSLLVDHRPGCPVRAAGERLMAIAGWSDADLAECYFRKVSAL